MSANDGPVDPGALEADAERAIRGATTTEELAEAESAILGKRSALAAAHRSLGGSRSRRPAHGRPALHEVRGRLERLVEDRRRELAAHERAAALEADRMDLTEVVVADVRSPLLRGHQHLVTTTRDALEDVFVAMGFTVAEGPEAETDWYNFEALNIPPAHPARGMYDSFYLDLGEPETIVLRTHTSPVQIHLMEQAVAQGSLPIHSVMPGTVLPARHRRRQPPAGVPPDRGAGGRPGDHLLRPGRHHRDVHDRLFRPRCPLAAAAVVLPVHRALGGVRHHLHHLPRRGLPDLLEHRVARARRAAAWSTRPCSTRSGIDPVEWSGFAFGFGIDRCAQMRHEMADMRALIENDLRFLRQF